jgi:hypothetical protein
MLKARGRVSAGHRSAPGKAIMATIDEIRDAEKAAKRPGDAAPLADAIRSGSLSSAPRTEGG